MKYLGFILASVLPLALAYEYRVGVGKDETTGRKGMGFDPSVIHPQGGDSIIFEFRSGVHSVVQSSFDNPCVGNGEFNSGVFTVSDDLAVDAPGLPIARVIVNDTQPLWFFDEAGGLCHRGAVLAVNPTAAQNEVVFKENAALPPKPASSTTPAASSTSGAASASGTPAANSDDVSSGSSGTKSNSSPKVGSTAWAAALGAVFGGLAVMA